MSDFRVLGTEIAGNINGVILRHSDHGVAGPIGVKILFAVLQVWGQQTATATVGGNSP